MIETQIIYHGNGVHNTYKDGTYKWYKNGKLHKDNGPAIIFFFGQQEWWIDGKKHRLDGPAVVKNDGSKYWFKNGKKHREDGAAVIHPHNVNAAWYIDGIELSEEEFEIFKLQKELDEELSTSPLKVKQLKI